MYNDGALKCSAHHHKPGCPSGQRELTVNQPSLCLRRFKSFTRHTICSVDTEQIVFTFLKLSSTVLLSCTMFDAPWCNGNTTVFGAVVPGSSPGGAAQCTIDSAQRGVAQYGKRTCFGSRGSQVQILSPRRGETPSVHTGGSSVALSKPVGRYTDGDIRGNAARISSKVTALQLSWLAP